MLTCITCSKQKIEEDDEEEEEAASRGTPRRKDAVKSLTTQIKDMALKVSGGHKGKSGELEGSFRRGPTSYPNFNAFPGSSSSTPAWNHATRRDSGFTSFGGDMTPGGHEFDQVVLEDEDEPREWIAQVEPGVQITFVSLPRGGNDLKRIRFSREMFDKWQAQRWWGENFDKITELYNVQKFNQQAPYTPGRSEDGRDSTCSRLESARESVNREWTPRYRGKGYLPPDIPRPSAGQRGEASYMEASRTTTSSRDEPSISISNASEIEAEWIEEDEPGVYITIRQLVDGTRELRRVRFSREKFGEVDAKQWWETNRDRIQNQYLS